MLYLLSFIPHKLFFEKTDIVYSVNYTFGCFLLMILVALEFNHQIQSDDILNYNKNKMFYINLGVVLFYIGTLPFFTFYGIFIKDMNMWNYYYTYFLIFNNCILLIFLYYNVKIIIQDHITLIVYKMISIPSFCIQNISHIIKIKTFGQKFGFGCF